MRRSTKLLLPLLLATLLVCVCGAVLFSARRALHGAANRAAAAHQVGFTLRPLDAAAWLAANPGFQAVASPMGATAGTALNGLLYLAGPGGLTVQAADGTIVRTLHTGLELPAAPLTAVAVGRLRGDSDPEVMLATAGAGLLLLTPGASGSPALRQLLPDGTASRDLTALLPLPTGDVLLGTRTVGVLVFRGASLEPLTPGTATLEVTALAAPTADPTTILIGTRNEGVLLLRAGTVEHADTASGLPDNQVDSILLDRRTAYVGTPVGVAQFDLLAPVFRPVRTLAPGLFAHALALSAEGLWVGTLEQGVQPVTLTRGAHLRRASIAASGAAAAAEDGAEEPRRVDGFIAQAGEAPVALVNGSAERRTASSWAVPGSATAAAALSDRNISALAFAPDGRLYVGFFDHGLDILSPEASAPAEHMEDDHLFCINRLLLDPMRHTMAAATADGLVLFDATGRPRQVLTRRDGLISDHVTDLAFTADGPVLATPAGLTFLTSSGAQSLYAFQGLVNNHVYTLAADPGGNNLLAGTLGGLSVVEAGAVKRSFTTANSGLAHNWITALAPMPGGGYLVGTYGAGLEQLSRQGVFTPVDLPAGTPRNVIVNPNALLVMPGHIVAGTLAHGMLVYTRATGRWSAVTAGLPSRNVTAFAERAGELYVGTENGLVRIAEDRLP